MNIAGSRPNPPSKAEVSLQRKTAATVLIPFVLSPDEVLYKHPRRLELLGRALEVAREAGARRVIVAANEALPALHGTYVRYVFCKDEKEDAMLRVPLGTSASIASLAEELQEASPLVLLNFRNTGLNAQAVEGVLRSMEERGVGYGLSACVPEDHPCQAKLAYNYLDQGFAVPLESVQVGSTVVSRSKAFEISKHAEHPSAHVVGSAGGIDFEICLAKGADGLFRLHSSMRCKGAPFRPTALALGFAPLRPMACFGAYEGGSTDILLCAAAHRSDARIMLRKREEQWLSQGPAEGCSRRHHLEGPFPSAYDFMPCEVLIPTRKDEGSSDVLSSFAPKKAAWLRTANPYCVIQKATGKPIRGRQDFPKVLIPDTCIHAAFRAGDIIDPERRRSVPYAIYERPWEESRLLHSLLDMTMHEENNADLLQSFSI
jgi:hypothetical protein